MQLHNSHIEIRAHIAKKANDGLRQSRYTYPVISEHSTREALLEWCLACDPNGVYTDANNEVEGMDPLTLDEAWEAVLNLCNEGC